ncbi:uncharacterized protein LOC144380048 [Halichoerus grypus]
MIRSGTRNSKGFKWNRKSAEGSQSAIFDQSTTTVLRWRDPRDINQPLCQNQPTSVDFQHFELNLKMILLESDSWTLKIVKPSCHTSNSSFATWQVSDLAASWNFGMRHAGICLEVCI